MIKVKYENKEYAYILQKSIWVTSANQIISSPEKADALRQIAIDNGYTDVDFKKPSSEMERYIKMLEDEKSSKSTKEVDGEEKPAEKKNSKLKSPTAVSLSDLLKKKKE